MEILQKDYLRFSRLHSWYKHIPIEGRDFYFYQDIGEQPRNGVHPDVKDLSGIHWHFYSIHPDYPTEFPDKPYYKTRVGPFLGGIHEGYDGKKYTFSFNLVLSCNEDTFVSWIAENYPQWAHLTLEDWEKRIHYRDDAPIVIELYESENRKYWLKTLSSLPHLIQKESIK